MAPLGVAYGIDPIHLGVVFLAERFGLAMAVGFGLVTAGSVLATRRPAAGDRLAPAAIEPS